MSHYADPPCTSYGPGHRVHFIQALQHSKDRDADLPGEVVSIEGQVVEVHFRDGTTARFRNHETERLRAVLARSGSDEVIVNRRWALLQIPDDGGLFCFSGRPGGGRNPGVQRDPNRLRRRRARATPSGPQLPAKGAEVAGLPSWTMTN